MAVSIKLQGVDFLQKQMKAYGPDVSKRAGDTGVREGAKLMARSLRNAAPRRSGRLRKQIGFKYYKKTGWAKVGLRRGKAETNLLAYYKTLEFGRRPYAKRSNGASYEGSPPLHPFFAKTYARLAPSVSQHVIDKATEAVFYEAQKVYQRSRVDQSRYGFRQGRVR